MEPALVGIMFCYLNTLFELDLFGGSLLDAPTGLYAWIWLFLMTRPELIWDCFGTPCSFRADFLIVLALAGSPGARFGVPEPPASFPRKLKSDLSFSLGTFDPCVLC